MQVQVCRAWLWHSVINAFILPHSSKFKNEVSKKCIRCLSSGIFCWTSSLSLKLFFEKCVIKYPKDYNYESFDRWRIYELCLWIWKGTTYLFHFERYQPYVQSSARACSNKIWTNTELILKVARQCKRLFFCTKLQ